MAEEQQQSTTDTQSTQGEKQVPIQRKTLDVLSSSDETKMTSALSTDEAELDRFNRTKSQSTTEVSSHADFALQQSSDARLNGERQALEERARAFTAHTQ
ncbi:hypothetical protein V866_006445 [Kwoniella sp. B9012]|uniref:Uncharacterized protein n=1 Tax=Kwoniella europaea PYCC6329 TaxID=1423913 RepID=A0AAX4KTK2_9TREE